MLLTVAQKSWVNTQIAQLEAILAADARIELNPEKPQLIPPAIQGIRRPADGAYPSQLIKTATTDLMMRAVSAAKSGRSAIELEREFGLSTHGNGKNFLRFAYLSAEKLGLPLPY